MPLSKAVLVLILCVYCLVQLSCRRPAPVANELVAACSVFPVYDMVKNIAGDRAGVFFIVPPGANPHTFEPTPSTVKKIREAGLFFGIDRRFDGWVEKFLVPGSEVVYLKAMQPHDHMHNPHIWLSPRNARLMCEEIASALSALSPADRDYFNAALGAYLMELEVLDRDIIALFEPVRNRQFIQWHPAWNYFADDYRLTVAGTIQKGHGETVSVRDFKELVDTAKSRKIRTVTIGLRVHSPETESLVREINGFLVRLDSIGDPADPARNSYIKLMRYNATILAEMLKKQ